MIDNGTSKFLYAHIRSTTAPPLWTNVSNAGDYIGEMVPGPFDDGPCGYASQNSEFFHVHLEFLNTPSLSLSDWTLNTSSEIWTRGGETWPAGEWRQIGTGVSFSDEFNSPTLDPRWYWINEDQIHWSLTASSGNLRIIGITGDMWMTCNNPTNLLLQQAPQDNFEVLTKLSIHPTTDYQQGGLIIFKDLDNYAKLDVLWSNVAGGENVEFIREQNGEVPPSLSWPFFAVDLNQPVFLKITKFGNTYTGFYSSNGQVWSIVGSLTFESVENPKIGVYAFSSFVDPPACAGDVPDIQVDFDYFRVTTGVGKTAIFKSQGAYDGWVLESTETSGMGSTKNNTAPTLSLGDDAAKKQYRSILSFKTEPLPDNAVITKVTLKLKRVSVAPVGTNSVSLLQGIFVDVRKGFFGTASGLQPSDFQTAAHKTVGPFKPALSAGWYTINLNSATFSFINKLATNGGLTQMRLRFKLDDNNNAIANILNLASGNHTTAANRPQLVIEYYEP